jgi:hypothetical protein
MLGANGENMNTIADNNDSSLVTLTPDGQPTGRSKTMDQIEVEAASARAAHATAVDRLSDINEVLKALGALEERMQYPALGAAERAALEPLVGRMAHANIELRAVSSSLPAEIDRLDDVALAAHALLVTADV